ncbi:helix-turn-helix transcriptional regulator [Minwuia thermotolerans]|uniref:HTH luxR-type domain-containing protein n=1 Tax=Minwuia thermotolerans TaxID=2056226 RepID=A0A2M9FW31_9PROT|nr:helix-turn-helix transcriptional regulator [Minwuia thermotolerans]PJK27676.1 hypothetical protein CVT23_20915 [Minwuia thermotolerans]
MEHILHAINSIYATTLDEEGWDGALRDVCDVTGAVGFNVFVLDHAAELIPVNRSIGIPDDILKDYSSYYVQKDPGIAHYVRNPNERFYYNYAHTPEEEIDRNEYYDWLQKMGGARYYLATTFKFDERYSGIVTAQRDRKSGHAQPEDMKLLGLISPHIQRAVEIGELVDQARIKADAALDAIERTPYGIFLLNREQEILFANKRARVIARRRAAIFVENRTIRCAKDREDRKLKVAIREAARASFGDSVYPGATLPVESEVYGRPYMVKVVPLIGQSRLITKERPSVLVVVTDFEMAPDDIERRRASLCSVYQLTEAEAIIAVRLGDAERPQDICDSLSISPNTLKTHRKRIFEKLNIATQAELARLVSTL